MNTLTINKKTDLYGLQNLSVDQLVYCSKDNTFYHLRDFSRSNKKDGWEQVTAIPNTIQTSDSVPSYYLTRAEGDSLYVKYQDAVTYPDQTIYGNVYVVGHIIASGEVQAYGGTVPSDFWTGMPAATTTTLGGIKVGANLTIVAGVLSAVGSGVSYPDIGIALSTGSAWDSSITNNSANWNTAYSWGDHALAGYAILSGSPVDTYLTRFNSTTTITGDSDMTWDGTTLTINGNIIANGEISAYGGSAPPSWWAGMPAATVSTIGGIIVGSNLTIVAGVLSASGSGVSYPLAGIPLSTGSAWSTSYSTSGTGTVVALTASPTFTGTLTLSSTTLIPDGGYIGQSAGPLLTFDDSNNYLEITGAAVVIGGTTPTNSRKLTVLADGTFSGIYSDGTIQMPVGKGLYITDGALDDTGIRGRFFTAGNYAYIDYYQELHFRSGASSSADVITFLSTGYVGLNTIAPSSRLHIYHGTDTAAIIKIFGSNSDGIRLTLGSHDASGYSSIYSWDENDGGSASYSTLYLGSADGSQGIIISSNGVLSITGTTKTDGYFYAGSTAPTNTTRLNYDGYLYASGLYSAGTAVSVEGHSHATEYISLIATPNSGNFPTMDGVGELATSAYGPSSFQPVDADLTAIAALGFTATSFLKKTAANTWTLDTNTYCQVVLAGASGDIMVSNGSGNITSSATKVADLEGAISKSTGYLRWTGAAWEWKNESYSLTSHNHSGTYEPVLGSSSTAYILSSTGTTRTWISKGDIYTAFQTLTYAASVTWNMNNGYNAKLTLTGDCTLTVTNASDGSSGCLILTQDASGGHTLTLWSSTYCLVIDGGLLTLDETANRINVLTFVSDGTYLYWSYGNHYLGTT